MKAKPLAHFARHLVVTLWLIALNPVSAQTAIEAWVQHYGVAYGEHLARAMAVDSAGNVVVTGTSQSGTPGGFYYDATIKYSGAGVPLWTNRFATVGTDNPIIAVDGNGNVIIAGTSRGASPSDYTYRVAMAYSSSGVPLWTNFYSPGFSTYPVAIAADNKGNVFVTEDDYTTVGYSGGGVPLWTNRYVGYGTALAVDGSGSVLVSGYSYSGDTPGFDFTTIKYSPEGVALWTNRYNGPGNGMDTVHALGVDGSGNVFVTGHSWNSSAAEYATVKYSSAGQQLWVQRYDNGGAGAVAYALAVDRGGNVAVTGVPMTGDEFITIKYSGAGVALWTNLFAGVTGQRPPVIAVDGAGNLVVAGTSTDAVIPSNYPYDYLTVAYSPAGVPLWTNRYDGPLHDSDELEAIAVDSNGNVFVTGTSGFSISTTIKYSITGLHPIPLDYQVLDNQLVLRWTNAAFSLESAPAAQGTYTNIPGAASPFTNLMSGAQQYFRLKAN